MAPRNKQDQLNRTYRRADVGRVGSSLRNQGYSQNSSGDTFYTVGGVRYNAATGRPVRNQPAAASPQPSRPAATATTSGGGRGGSATPPASRPASAPASRPASPAADLKIPKPEAPKPNIGPVADGEAYARSKDPKKYNPLMQRTFGYQTGNSPGQIAARNKTEGVGPVADGKAYADSLKVKPRKTESLQDQIRKRRFNR